MFLPKNINLVNQDDMRSCSLACIAMVTDHSVSTVRASAQSILNIKAPCTDFEVIKLLCFYRLYGVGCLPHEMLDSENVYIVSTNSLNSANGFHHVICDLRGGDFICYDPQFKRAGKKYYKKSGEGLKIINAIKVLPLVEKL